jgi:hypothetical protein
MSSPDREDSREMLWREAMNESGYAWGRSRRNVGPPREIFESRLEEGGVGDEV